MAILTFVTHPTFDHSASQQLGQVHSIQTLAGESAQLRELALS